MKSPQLNEYMEPLVCIRNPNILLTFLFFGNGCSVPHLANSTTVKFLVCDGNIYLAYLLTFLMLSICFYQNT